jgi:hypothetical protein
MTGVGQQTVWQEEGFLILIDVLTVTKLKNLSTTYSCHVFLQENSGSNFYKELACSSFPRRSVRSYLMIGGNESMYTLGTSYRKASTPLSSLVLRPCGFIVISVCLMESLKTWLDSYCSLGMNYLLGFGRG